MILYTKLFELFDKYGIKQTDLKNHIGNETLRKLKLFNTYQDCKTTSFCYGVTIDEINEQLIDSVNNPMISGIRKPEKKYPHPYINRGIDSRVFDEICRWMTEVAREKENKSNILIQPKDIMEFVEDDKSVMALLKKNKIKKGYLK